MKRRRQGSAATVEANDYEGALEMPVPSVPVEGETGVDAAYRMVDEAVARERVRIARELHDGLAADLATSVELLKYYFESAARTE